MRAIVNGKLYDTEKSMLLIVIFVPDGDSHTKTLDAYRTPKGNIFAVCRSQEIILDSDQIKELLNGKPELKEAYINLFGMPEEA